MKKFIQFDKNMNITSVVVTNKRPSQNSMEIPMDMETEGLKIRRGMELEYEPTSYPDAKP